MTPLFSLLLGAALSTLVAQVGRPDTTSQQPTVSDPQVLAEAHAIGDLLRCPVCQGMPISESPSQMAQDMMARVRTMVADGQTRAEILAYFVERYGEWALLQPRAEGLNLALWLLPAAALLAGGGLVARYVYAARRRTPGREPSPEHCDDDAATLPEERT